MSYVEQNLATGERVVHTANLHWFAYVPGISLLLLSMFFYFGFGTDTSAGQALGTFGCLVGVGYLAKAWVAATSTELAVTSKRVIAKTGLIKRQTVELNHGKVESLNVDQTVPGRIFGFGTLIVNGTGGGRTRFPGIQSPMEFRRKAMETIDAGQSGAT